MICTFKTQFRHLINYFIYCGFIASLEEKKVQNKKNKYKVQSRVESPQTPLAFKNFVTSGSDVSSLFYTQYPRMKKWKAFLILWGQISSKRKVTFCIDKSGYFQVCLCFVLPTAAGLPHLSLPPCLFTISKMLFNYDCSPSAANSNYRACLRKTHSPIQVLPSPQSPTSFRNGSLFGTKFGKKKLTIRPR